MAEYSDRSNDPRITKGAKKDNAKYQMALEVARQPADTPEQRKQQKRAAVYARAFESRFQKEAFKLSGGTPLSAGGKGAYKDPEKVKMNIKNPSSKKASAKYSPAPMTAKKKETTRRAAEKKQAVTNIKKDVKKIAGAAGKAAGFVTKAAMAPSVGVTKVAKAGLKALTKEPRTRRMYRQGDPLNKLKDIKKAKKK
jgi:hypothetical protein